MPDRKPNTLRALIDVYAAKKLRRKSPSTKLKYGYAVDHWSDQLGREPLLTDLRDDPVCEYQDQLLDLTTLADVTVEMYVKKILALWRFAFHQRWVWKWPAIELAETSDKIPIAWTEPQLRVLFSALRRQTGFIGAVPAADWWIAQHWLIWHTSERIGAIMGLEWPTLDLSAGYVVFPAGLRKGRRRETGYPLGPHCVAALQRIREPVRERVFPFPWDRSMLWRRYKAILQGAGLPFDRKHMFHALRKSVASHMEAAGADSTDTLGHSDRAITKRYYLDPRIARTVKPCDVLFNPDAPPEPGAA